MLCGGSGAIDLYTFSPALLTGFTCPSTSGTTVQTEGAYSWQGCFAEPVGSRALTDFISYDLGQGQVESVDGCYAYCTSQAITYKYFYVEYYGQCKQSTYSYYTFLFLGLKGNFELIL